MRTDSTAELLHSSSLVTEEHNMAATDRRTQKQHGDCLSSLLGHLHKYVVVVVVGRALFTSFRHHLATECQVSAMFTRHQQGATEHREPLCRLFCFTIISGGK